MTREVLLEVALFVIDALSSSTSLKTLDRSIVVAEASSRTETDDIALTTVGGSSTSLTVTVKVSFTSTVFEVPITVIVAVPFWSA